MDRLGFIEKELNLERQKGTQPTTFTGIYRGYYLVFEVNEAGGESANQFIIKVGATFSEDKRWFIDLRNEVGSEHNSFIEKHRHIIMVLGKLPQKNKEVKEFTLDLLNNIINTLIENDVATGDFINGEQDNVALYLINNHYNYLSEASYQQILEKAEDTNTTNNEKETSIQAGLGKATLVAIIGAVIWGIINYFSVHSWIAALVLTHLVFVVYSRNSGKLNALAVTLISLIVMVTLFLSHLVIGALILPGDFILFSPNILLNIGVVVAYTLIFAYGLYSASKEKDGIKKV